MKKLFFYFLSFYFIAPIACFETVAQSTGINTVNPNSKAALDVMASGKQGFIMPRMATADTTNIGAVVGKDKGLMFFDTLIGDIRFWNGSKWKGGGGSSSTPYWYLTGNSLPDTSSHFLGTTNNTPVSIRTNGVERIHVAANGNVGLGTFIPAAGLDVAGNIANNIQAIFTRSADPNFQLYVANGAGLTAVGSVQGKLGLRYAGTGDAATISFHRGTAALDADMAFNTNGAERMRITSTGFVGIATNAPSTSLHIGTSSYVKDAFITLATGNGSGATRTWQIGVPYGGATVTDPNYGFVIKDVTGGRTPVAISYSTGYVGINSTAPTYQLTLGGTGGVLGVDNTALFFARNTGGAYEGFLWPRWSDNVMYMNYGSGGFNIRNSASSSTMFITNGGNVGIGTTNPGATLHTTGTLALGTAYLSGGVTPSGAPLIEANANDLILRPRVDDAGYGVQIHDGNSATFLALSSGGNGYIQAYTSPGVVANLYLNPSGGTICASSSIVVCSDVRYKQNVVAITSALASLKGLRGVYYDWKIKDFPEQHFDSTRQIGVIAQELEKVYPELIFTNDKGYKMVDYPGLTPVLLQAIKEQQSLVESQQSTLKKQESQIQLLEQKLSVIEQKVNELLKVSKDKRSEETAASVK